MGQTNHPPLATVVATAAIAGTVTYSLYKLVKYHLITSTLSAGNVPTIHTLFSPGAFIGNAFPSDPPHPNDPSSTSWWWNIARGNSYHQIRGHSDYLQSGWNLFAIVSPLPDPQSVVFTADAGVIKTILSSPGAREKFPKPMQVLEFARRFGLNVVATEGAEWKTHRRVTQPAFSEANNRLVWNAADRLTLELMDEIWTNQDEVYIPQMLDICTKLALMVLSHAAFAKPLSFKPPPPSLTHQSARRNESMPFDIAISLVSSSVIPQVLIPRFIINAGPTQYLRDVRDAMRALGAYMDEFIQRGLDAALRGDGGKGRQKDGGGKGDLLTNLVNATLHDEGEGKGKGKEPRFSFDDLKGNVFVYLVAGHETTAHTLVYAFGLLALYPDVQARLYEHVKEVLGERVGEATYDDFPKLKYVLAVLYETLRLYPPASTILKETTTSTTFTVTSSSPSSSATKQMVIPAGVMIMLHTAGLHRNPRYWNDPEEFNPERFMQEWNKDAFIPFSGGARSCIGRKFAEVESVCILTALISRYTVHVSPHKEGEFTRLGLATVAERRERLLRSVTMVTLTPLDVPLVFKMRAEDESGLI